MPTPQRREPSPQRSALLFSAAVVLAAATLASVVRDVAAAQAGTSTKGDVGQDERKAALKTYGALLKTWNDISTRLTNAWAVAAQGEEEPAAESEWSEESDELEASPAEEGDDGDEDHEEQGAELAKQESDPAVEARSSKRFYGRASSWRALQRAFSWHPRISSLKSVSRGVPLRGNRILRRPTDLLRTGKPSRTERGSQKFLKVVGKALKHTERVLGIAERVKNLIAPIGVGVAPIDAGVAPIDAGVAPIDARVAPIDAGVSPSPAAVVLT